MKLILASQSPRRRELLEGLGYCFEVQPSSKEEIFDHSMPIDLALEKVALAKAKDIHKQHPQDVVVAADTIVYFNKAILGKPKTPQEAFDMIKSLSGKIHEVKTGVVVLNSKHQLSHVETTKVHFRDLCDEEIRQYVLQGSCMDKAGSYGIQDVDFVKELEGSYSNVVGLPLTVTDTLLKKIQEDPKVRF